jgi:hypothetical protein
MSRVKQNERLSLFLKRLQEKDSGNVSLLDLLKEAMGAEISSVPLEQINESIVDAMEEMYAKRGAGNSEDYDKATSIAKEIYEGYFAEKESVYTFCTVVGTLIECIHGNIEKQMQRRMNNEKTN